MNTSFPEMLHGLNTPENFSRNGGVPKMSMLERQEARFKWQQEQLQHPPPQLQQEPLDYFSSNAQLNVFSMLAQAQHFQGSIIYDQKPGGLLTQEMKPDLCLVNSRSRNNSESIGGDSSGYGGSGYEGNITGFEMNYAVARTASCPPAVAATMAEVATAASKGKEMALSEKLSSTAGRESFKKRKADNTQNLKVVREEETKDTKSKGWTEEKDSKVTEQGSTTKNTASNINTNTEPSDASKENTKISEVQKPDYIHVRARRGQATDSHSLAERVRREKISERMKYLQDLVPGCNKITGKAGMLDEIINYVQSLQRQVEFLSMKLAAVDPRPDLDIDRLFDEEVFPDTTSEFHTVGVRSEINIPLNYQFDCFQQVVSCCGMEIEADPPDVALRRTINAPVSIPQKLVESTCFNHSQPYSTWDVESQNLYGLEFQEARSTSLLSQPCTGNWHTPSNHAIQQSIQNTLQQPKLKGFDYCRFYRRQQCEDGDLSQKTTTQFLG